MKSSRVFGPTAKCAPSRNALQCRRTRRFIRPLLDPGQGLCGAPVRSFQSSPVSGQPWSIAPHIPPSVHPHSSTTESVPMSEQLRALMRLVAHSVVICTSTGLDPESQARTPRAMTMSSFTSLALTPSPVVSFNIATPSRTLDAVQSSRMFVIHILAGGAAGARVADRFSRGNEHGAGRLQGLHDCGVEIAADGSGEVAPTEPPVLRGEGILYAMRCRLLDEPSRGLIRVQDHVIVLGEVVEIIEVNTEGGTRGANDCFGLVYADRQYRQLGNTLTRAGTVLKTQT